MTCSLLPLDVVLTLELVAIGASVLLARDLFQSIVLFIVFGMLLGIAWCRLQAVDVALAEVAIGAGLTGALLLNTLAATRGRSLAPRPPVVQPVTDPNSTTAQATAADAKPDDAQPPRRPLAFVFAVVLFTTVSAGGLTSVVVPLVYSGSAVRIAIGEALPSSGADNPVTAVLLNFRAYDTLLEVAVLVAAVFAVLAVSTRNGGQAHLALQTSQPEPVPVGPVLGAFARLLVPLAVLVATYVLWIGTTAPGGAFQAAAILGAGGVLLIVCGAQPPSCTHRRWRVLLAGGLVVFLLVGVGGVVAGGRFLELSPRWAGGSIMLVETALTASLALILIVLFGSTSPSHDARRAAGIENEPAPTADQRTTGSERDGGSIDIQEPSP